MYRIADPPADLAPFVRFFWGATADAVPHQPSVRVVPDGCCELIVHFGEPFRQLHDREGWRAQPRGFLFGQLEKAMLLAPSGATGMVAVRFRPAGVHALFGIEPRALAGSAVPLGSLFGRAGELTVERIASVPHIDQGWALLVQLLRSQAAARVACSRAMAAAHLASLLAKPRASIRGIARELAVSSRSIERRFVASVGLTPKQFARIARVDVAARMLRAERAPLSAIASDAGYADQAHLSREFRALIGIAPGEYVRELGREHTSFVP